MRDYIEYRVYIKDSSNADLLLKVAGELHDVIQDYVGDSVVAYAGEFVDTSSVLQSGDASYEVHLDDN